MVLFFFNPFVLVSHTLKFNKADSEHIHCHYFKCPEDKLLYNPIFLQKHIVFYFLNYQYNIMVVSFVILVTLYTKKEASVVCLFICVVLLSCRESDKLNRCCVYVWCKNLKGKISYSPQMLFFLTAEMWNIIHINYSRVWVRDEKSASSVFLNWS